MKRQSLELHWNEMRTRLLPLHRLLAGDSKAGEMFDEFIENNEFGLALHIICDSVLEREEVRIGDRDIEAIETLHEQMQIRDECVAALRQLRKNTQ